MMRDFYAELKSIAEIKVEITKVEKELWQRLSRALDRLAKTAPEEKAEPAPQITLIQQAQTSRYLNATQAAKYLGISKTALYKLRGDKILKYVKIGNMPRYKVDDLDAIATRII